MTKEKSQNKSLSQAKDSSPFAFHERTIGPQGLRSGLEAALGEEKDKRRQGAGDGQIQSQTVQALLLSPHRLV